MRVHSVAGLLLAAALGVHALPSAQLQAGSEPELEGRGIRKWWKDKKNGQTEESLQGTPQQAPSTEDTNPLALPPAAIQNVDTELPEEVGKDTKTSKSVAELLDKESNGDLERKGKAIVPLLKMFESEDTINFDLTITDSAGHSRVATQFKKVRSHLTTTWYTFQWEGSYADLGEVLILPNRRNSGFLGWKEMIKEYLEAKNEADKLDIPSLSLEMGSVEWSFDGMDRFWPKRSNQFQYPIMIGGETLPRKQLKKNSGQFVAGLPDLENLPRSAWADLTSGHTPNNDEWMKILGPAATELRKLQGLADPFAVGRSRETFMVDRKEKKIHLYLADFSRLDQRGLKAYLQSPEPLMKLINALMAAAEKYLGKNLAEQREYLLENMDKIGK